MPRKSHKNLTGADEEGTQRKGSSGTIKSESGISSLKSAKQVGDVTETSRRAVVTMKVKNITSPSTVANSGQGKLEQTRFPKLEEYAHFHYDLVEIPTLKLSVCTDDASGYKHNLDLSEDSGMFLVTVLASAPKSWLIKRSLENFATLDVQLHRCIFDRRFSHLNDLSTARLEHKPRQEVQAILHSYLTHFSELAGGMINCGSVLSWMEMDNRGHRLVATDDSGINTPAIAAAHVIKRYNAQAADEITLQVGDMISVIDMPSAEDTIWWRGKRGFEVGFFPAECVEIIGDKIPTSMATRIPEPVATASASRRPLMKKHGKLLSFLRTFFSHRPPRNQLKQSGIVKERVFGCDLGEHLLNSGHDVPLLLKSCTDIIEEYGIVHGIYRLSGITSNIQKLRLAFDEDRVPDLTEDCYLQDIHSISSLLKMYFRELPNPLLTYQLYDKFADAVRDEENKLLKIHDVVQQLPPPHYRTTEYLMRHLARVAAFGHETEMHSKNLAIVWAPNLLRSKELEAGGGAAALQGVGIQAVVTECLICYCDIIFSDKMPDYNCQDSIKGQKKARPKSLAISTPTRLLSLEEARERAFVGHMAPKKFIDVGGGPRNLPSKYHTVIDLPGYRKRAPSTSSDTKPASGNKKMSTTCGGGGGSGGWKSIFIKPRSGSIKKFRKCDPPDSVALGPGQGKALTEEDVHNWKRHLRSAKSAESLFSLMNTQSSYGSLSSRASASVSETVSHAGPDTSTPPSQGLASRLQLSHKRSLSSDASAILHHCCSTTDASLHHQSPDDQDKHSFQRGDSARKALHRRLPSAPSTPHEDRKSVREMVSADDNAAGGHMARLPSAQSQNEADINIHAKINFRLLQVAEKTRCAKSQEELTSPLKRMARCSPKGSKKAKGADNVQVGFSDDELCDLVTEKKTFGSSSCLADASPCDSSKALRPFYSRYHDYAEIVSDDDVAVISTPDSQGAMSVSSSGCNMQDVLDQIDTRLALNAKLFPRQGIGDTSGYRVGDPPLNFADSRNLPRSKHIMSPSRTDLATVVLPTSSVSTETVHARQCCTGISDDLPMTDSPTDGFPMTDSLTDDLPMTDSPKELYQFPEGSQSWQADDIYQQSSVRTMEVGREHNSFRDKTVSTLVGRRHTEFIPSLSAAARDLHNLHELLNSLTGDGSQPDGQARARVLPKNHKPSRSSSVQVHQDPNTSRMLRQRTSTTAATFEPKVEDHLANMSAGVGGVGMSKCLSVPSDIARSLENVTESQSDMLSSITISELSASINSFSNALGQETAIAADEARAQIDVAERRHRRSTSLDSLTENDRLMTRTLREINSQMESAFQHSKINGSSGSLDSVPHHQRLAVSELELTSAAFCGHKGTEATTEDVNSRACSENHLHLSPNNITALSLSDRLQPSSNQCSLFQTDADAASPELSQETLSSHPDTHDPVSDTASCATPPCLSLNNVRNQPVCDLTPASCFISSRLSFNEEQQLVAVRQYKNFDYAKGDESACHQQCRHAEKQTHRQNDEHILIETTHVVRFKSPELDKGSQQYRHQSMTPSSQQHVHSRSDIASVCTNRSSSSSSCTSSEYYDEVAELSEGVSHKCNFSLPLGNILCPPGNISCPPGNMCSVGERLTQAAASSTVQPVANSQQAALHVSLPTSDSEQYQVVRRQHSPRVEQRSPRCQVNFDGTRAYFENSEDSVVSNDRWKPLFSSDSHVNDIDACEHMSSLCAAGLMSQRVRLSRDSSVSSLHSPDTSSPCVLSASAPSPLATPVREALPDLIQSTTQTEPTDADNRRCSVPLHLALYHPDEFAVDIPASVSGHNPSSRCMPLHPSPSLPQVHSISHTVVVTKSTLTKSSTDNSLSEATTTDRTIQNRHRTAQIDGHDLVLDNLNVHEAQTFLQAASFNYADPDEENTSAENIRTCGDEGNDAFNHNFISKTSQMVRLSRGTPFSEDFNGQLPVKFNSLCNRLVDECQPAHLTDSQLQASAADCKLLLSTDGASHGREHVTAQVEVMQIEPSCVDEEHAFTACRSPDTGAQMFFLYNSDAAMDKEEVQNAVNQGREILMSPELVDKPEQREKSYQSLHSPSAGPVRRTSFSKIPRPKQSSDLTSPRTTNNGVKKTEFLYSSSMASSVHVDTSPSSSSSSTSSSSRVGHTRRGSEVSSAAKRQCHIRRSSDTKLTELQTLSPTSRCHSSSSNKPDLPGTGRPVTSPRNRGSDNKTGSADGAKSSRIPLSHRMPSPQSSRGADTTGLGTSKQISKIPSPIPKPRKLNLTSKGSHATVPVEVNSYMKPCRTDMSGRVSSGKGTAVRRDAEPNSAVKKDAESLSAVKKDAESNSAVKKDAECNSKKTVIIKDVPSRSGAKLVIESQTDMNKVQTVHATKVSQPTRQVAGLDPAAELTINSAQLYHGSATCIETTSGGIARTQSHLQTEVRTVGDKKTPPPVAARKFTYDSRSLPRRCRFLESQISFPGQQACCEQYSDMLGSRSSLDDSILQLAAERHDLFVPDISEDGGGYSNCLGSLRVKRSQKMQSLMDLFEHGSDSNVSDSSGTQSPGAQHHVRTFSGSLTVQGGLLTPCVEAGLGDISTVYDDDDTFLPPTSEYASMWSRERFPSRAGTGSTCDDHSENGGKMRAQDTSHACLCSSVTLSQGRNTSHRSTAEQRSTSFKQTAETSGSKRSSPSTFDQISDSNSLKLPHHYQLPESRTRSNSSSDSCTTHNTNVFTARPSSFSGTDLQLRTCSQVTDTHLQFTYTQPSAFERQNSNCVSIDPAHRQADRHTIVATQLVGTGNSHNAHTELPTTVGTSRGNSVNTPPSSPPKNSERRNSIKELRQLFERADTDGSTMADNGLSNPEGQAIVVRSRVRSISPQTDHESKRDKLVRLSLEIAPTSVTCQGSQSEVKVQPLRLGPKPFYGAHK